MDDRDATCTGKFANRAILERQTTQLIGIAQGLIADDHLADGEIYFLHKWLIANDAVRENPLISTLIVRIDEVLADGVIDEEERADLHSIIARLTASDFEMGELAKSTTLPLTDPAPAVVFEGKRFCCTGTFTFGKRRDCEAAIAERGGVVASLTKKTDFMVVGAYATESWKYESFGNKILKAVEMQKKGTPIAIVSEEHWQEALA